MEISVKEMGDVGVIKLEGRLDAHSAKKVKDTITGQVKAKLINLVVDMGAIKFMDSSGLGTLVASLNSVRRAKGQLKIASIHNQVRAIFELTRLHLVFEIFDDVQTAVNSF
ncbi:STAS domain-containing protein [Desulfococcaceae bacterium HSG7]|nr:STAS domain-containing protein [Desulfococcaceae bacterium HSG7]